MNVSSIARRCYEAKKPLRYILLCIVIFPLALVLFQAYLSSVDFYASDSERKFEEKIKFSLSNGIYEIPLKSSVDFKWKKVCIGHASLKIDNQRARGFLLDDHIWNLAFTKETGEIEFFRIFEKDFSPLNTMPKPLCFEDKNVNLVLKECEHIKGKCFYLEKGE